ncbi:YggT family protein [Pseudoalteromonas sp. MMG013]|uniref:YggT family protein n=1 Tax=Pseudoalteromonas aurantia 208 TaxID=1314867 RepID=A0ABR9EAM5_9GAMM|nr:MULTISPECIES: YggT family protein [Pseudoalteromonas]MBE0366843.1 YggT family protein [Pseudoalteromonas aurantia 208]MBQ4847043.1 YggT family protein [Pseudoalteromonas sp. MMG005]MBQ4849588.1 YggT family protein [Pseudoalteromonas sp. MMG012]MBQ4861451.1 YggT family protein [Pseudoalteromonas sp. MMG013]
MNAMQFLIGIIFDLFLMVVLLRFWLQLAKADFYNPLSQTVVKATSFAVNPLRKIIPGAGGLDLASLVLAFLIGFAKVSLLMVLFYGGWNGIGAAISGVMTVFKEAFSLVFWILIIRAVLSWVSQGYNPTAAVFEQLTEPMLRPIRKVIPPLGGLDLSILVLIIGMQFLQILVTDLLR